MCRAHVDHPDDEQRNSFDAAIATLHIRPATLSLAISIGQEPPLLTFYRSLFIPSSRPFTSSAGRFQGLPHVKFLKLLAGPHPMCR